MKKPPHYQRDGRWICIYLNRRQLRKAAESAMPREKYTNWKTVYA